MKRYLPFAIVLFVALATTAGTIFLYRAQRSSARSLASAVSPTLEPGKNHIRGNPEARVTLEEYGDFECPPCGRMADALRQIENDYQPNLRLIFHNYPLAVHLHARDAALAAEAAGLQGKFWEMHDLIYREQTVWSRDQDARALFNSYAGSLGLDLDRFKRDMDADTVKQRVDSDQKEGAAIGVKNTPTLFLNNRAIDPKNLDPAGVRAAIDRSLKPKSTS